MFQNVEKRVKWVKRPDFFNFSNLSLNSLRENSILAHFPENEILSDHLKLDLLFYFSVAVKSHEMRIWKCH